MSDGILLIELVVVFLFLCMIRVPIVFAMLGSTLLLAIQIGVSPLNAIAQMYNGIGLFVLLAIPFFLFAGELLNASGLTDDLIRTMNVVVGRIRGGLGQVNIVVSMVFAGISGSSTADTAAVGSVMIPAMERAGFTSRFAAAVTAASSTMGNIIPPSLYMIIYGSMAGVSIEKLFLAGVVPGLLVGISQMALVAAQARRPSVMTASTDASTVEFNKVTARTVLRTIATGSVGVLIIGGLVFGFFTATEAAGIAAIYCLLLLFAFRTPDPFRRVWNASHSTIRMTAAILLIIGAARAFGWVLAYLNGVDLAADAMLSVSTNPIVILLVVSALLLVLGTFMSEIAVIVIFTPIFIKLQEMGGIDPIQMGVVVVMMLCLGLITPPYGVCLLIAAKISKASFTEVSIAIIPFILVFLLIVLAVILLPEIALFLPEISAR